MTRDILGIKAFDEGIMQYTLTYQKVHASVLFPWKIAHYIDPEIVPYFPFLVFWEIR